MASPTELSEDGENYVKRWVDSVQAANQVYAPEPAQIDQYNALIQNTSKAFNKLNTMPPITLRPQPSADHLRVLAECAKFVGGVEKFKSNAGAKQVVDYVGSSSAKENVPIVVTAPEPQVEHVEAAICKTIKPFGESELLAVPSYLRLRLTVNDMNAAIDIMNGMLIDKYTLMGTRMSQLEQADKQRVVKWKEMNNAQSKGHTFITEDEIRKALPTAMASQLKTILPSLRHCKRTTEVRGGNLRRICVS